MKNILIIILIASLGIISCTKDLDKLNTDPTRASADIFDANLLLPTIQVDYVSGNRGYNGAILFQSMWVKILASTSTDGANYYTGGDKYVQSTNTNNYINGMWSNMYRSAGRAYEMAQLVADKPEQANLTHIAKIMEILAIAQMTDTYGDLPYSEALKGKTENITLPTYDTQESLYPQLLADLEAAVNGLSTSGAGPTYDAFYGGNISAWKKFGNSLMLRMAMKLVKAAPSVAQQYAEKAASGGVFENVSEECYINLDNANGYSNGNASSLRTGGDLYEVRWSERMINMLKSTNDPRLSVVAEVPPPGLQANQDLNIVGNSDPSVQLGLPNGWDLKGGSTDITNAPNFPGPTGSGDNATPLGAYSRPTAIYRNLSAPAYILSYAEVQFLLAEAAARGWNVGGSAADYFKNGMEGGVLSLAKMGEAASISQEAATAFANTNVLDESSLANSLKMINEQYWVATGLQMNFVEAWNNWKRSGYPILTPVNYVGNFSGGEIPRRQPYPTGETTLNTENYETAVGRLSGGDNWVSRIYWDQ
ncbi:SusD/RagB family nutrient-binding outer membrane lipoprotein [Membranihabitans marinus]|uniref:SusD/RagB family nutrient-binding outer membrane lipoprotein n=1 Tax=Membranihabitans marinus TaxID=1227546 RepID=UPI001F44CAE5|nr:SusD/RagB family nutrient-binding outer membrane lipoprotein [Membranihabitans marinus]